MNLRPGRLLRMKRVTASVAAVALSLGIGVASGTGTASALQLSTWFVPSCGMPSMSGGPAGTVKVRVWSRPGNAKTVVLLDGLRATNDMSGWEHNTNVGLLADHGVNVVEPVGGLASFYTDWDAPSNLNNQRYRYMWNCVITRSLVNTMDAMGLRGPSGHYAIMGISMGGNAAMVIAANNPRDFDRAGSMSGFLNLSAPGMREAIRIALLDAGIEAGVGPFNSDSMWGPPWSTRWLDNDPFVQINKFRGKKVFIGAGSGVPGQYDNVIANPMLLLQGVPLEVLSLAQTRVFQAQAAINRVPVMTDFPPTGTHSWPYWQKMMWDALAWGFFK
jgi:diacylglycerol O-acyltransferase/trehalose O-mycolyltransferase